MGQFLVRVGKLLGGVQPSNSGRIAAAIFKILKGFWSGRGDLNARPPAPKAVPVSSQSVRTFNYLLFNQIGNVVEAC
jgi:hypothetical protein